MCAAQCNLRGIRQWFLTCRFEVCRRLSYNVFRIIVVAMFAGERVEVHRCWFMSHEVKVSHTSGHSVEDSFVRIFITSRDELSRGLKHVEHRKCGVPSLAPYSVRRKFVCMCAKSSCESNISCRCSGAPACMDFEGFSSQMDRSLRGVTVPS